MSTRRILSAFIFAAGLAGALAGCGKPPQQDRSAFVPPAGKYDAYILRDTWGVAHNYGKTDADAAYALAFSHCEDDATNIEDGILSARGKLASVRGVKFAPFDYIWHLFRVQEFADERYERDLSPEVRAVLEAYAEGITHFAAVYPDRMPHIALPVTGKEVAGGFMLKAPFFYELHTHLLNLMQADHPGTVSEKVAAALIPTENLFTGGLPIGSNAWAVGPSRSADGHTRMALNSHQPWDGPVAWYEAHITSGEGWNMYGGTMPGGPMIFSGHDENKGWCHTVNRPDLVDIYAIEINPDNPDQYKFDGEWKTIEKRMAPLTIKLWGNLRFTVNRECLWTVHGPAVRTSNGVYALTFAGLGEMRMIEQWYRMNKAKNLDEFKDALRIGGLVSFNTVYADREGNLFYLYNGQFPERNPAYDWSQYLPGNTSETLWGPPLPFESKPQLLNPASGLVFSCNNTPYAITSGDESPKPEDFPKWMGIETGMTNRSYRVLETYGADDSITAEEFHAYKFDTQYSEKSSVASRRSKLLELDLSNNPELQPAQELLRSWNLRADADNTAAPLAFLTCVAPMGYASALGMAPRPFPSKGIDRLQFAVDHLTQHFGGIEVRWSDFCRLRRGNVDAPLEGTPDVLRDIDGALEEDGRLKATYGDGWFMFVDWDADGKLTSETIHQYGAAATDPDSPHYDDQAPLFAREEMRPTLLTEEQVRQHLKREYRPGELHAPWYETDANAGAQ
ncbi:MAG: acylase [Candidatus Hydrogenedens sp.]|nr:acylase [Candidatus Hydrogenedens sp.]